MSSKSEENNKVEEDEETTSESEPESGDDFASDSETQAQNSAVPDHREKFVTEEELAAKCAENNGEIDYLDKVDRIIHDTQIVRPLFQNVSASYADEVPFLVDGDSLLITLMNDKNWSAQLGGCTLHLVYIFEKYLNIFKERGGHFYIVFFECWRNIWNENWNVLLYRSLLINHFKKNTSYAVHLFDNCFDERFSHFLSYVRPGFILFNMDSCASCSHLETIDKLILRNITNIHLIMWLYFDLPCIDTNCIEVDISIVKGYYLEANPIVRTLVRKFGNRFKSFIEELPKIEERVQTSKLIKISSPDNHVRRMVFLNAAAIFYEMDKDDELIKVFFLTEALKEYLQLKNRCCPKFTTNATDLNDIVNNWHKCMYFALSNIENENCNWTTAADMWQGLLFGHVCRFAADEIQSAEAIGEQLSKIYENIVNDFNDSGHSLRPYPIHLSLSLNLNWETLASLEINERSLVRMPLVPVQNSLVLEFCGDILHNINWTEPPVDLFMTPTFTEDHHFHVLKKIHDEYDSIKDTYGKMPTDPFLRKRYMRHLNLHAKYMTIYGSSVEGRPLESSGVIRNVNAKKSAKETKQKPSKKAEIIINNNKEKKTKSLEEVEKEHLEKVKACLKKPGVKLEDVLNNINITMTKIHPGSIYELDILFLKLKVLMQMLKGENSNLRGNAIFELKKNIYLSCHKICTMKPLNIVDKQKRLLAKCLERIDCAEIARRNKFLLDDGSSSSSSSADDTWIRFQLEQLGPELVREVSGQPDLRAKNFIPDPWQKRLFDIVDKKESAVIVAPTSSGKTYASYYCMESVLREGTKGVVVYVAPTKALVNQVAATVYARFKNTKMPEGMTVYGVFTRDYKTNTTNSQILVTVPEALEILLTSPRQYGWCERLRYVIFDEVHCIAGDLGAVAFERCLLLIRCPFLALSATIRNPRLLQSWLQKAEDFKQLRAVQDGVPAKHSYKVNLVEHSDRHSDLIKYTYGNGKLHHLHPYAHLNNRVINNHNGIPKHFVLSPAETLNLYDAMLKANNDSDELHNLSPGIYFSKKPENGFISRNMVEDYAKDLKRLLEMWHHQNSDSFKATISYLRTNDIDAIVGKGSNYILDNIVEFILHLERNNMLPAIVFSYNRSLVQYMTRLLTEHFMDSRVEMANRRDEKRALKMAKEEKKKREKEAAKQKLETPVKRYSRSLNLISDPKEKSLQGVGKMTSDDIKYIEYQLINAQFRPNDIWTNAIRNGVMMHHGGLGSKIRSSVEMLFRSRILNVVFATGTLALGIHMPCKTTVIAGSSAYLNSLEYHQMAGRAGRRGYDTTGNVVFFGINPRKQHSLLTANLPELKGSYPITVTYVLRLMLLVTDVTERGQKTETATKVTVSRVMALLENVLSYMHNPNLKINIKHFFSFSLQLLKSQEYLNENGEALKWVGLVTHLHYHEPGNLALVHLFRSGAFRQLCTNNSNAPEDLLVVLSYLFNRLPLDASSTSRVFKNSVVILRPLPDSIRQSLEVYNAQVKFVFDQYLLNVAEYFTEDDNQLPLSSVTFVGSSQSSGDRSTDCLENKFLRLCTPKLVCSSFAALSGNDDNNLYSSENIVNNIKQKMSTDVKIIPLVDLNTQLNSYALDFYKHGIVDAIRNDNGLKSGLEYAYLTDFLLVLKTIVVSLEQMGADENDIVYANFKKLEKSYFDIHNKNFSAAHF